MAVSRAERKPAYWAVIPATVRYDPDLPANAKLMYGEIQALATAEGYCWATNEYFAQLYGLSIRTVRGLVSKLASKDHILVEVLRSPETNEVLERRIWVDRRAQPDMALPPTPPEENCLTPPEENCLTPPEENCLTPPEENCLTPPEENCLTPPEENCLTPPEENCRKNNTSYEYYNTPPIVPPTGGQGEGEPKPKKTRKKREAKSAPDWMPERFQAFWEAYPCGDGKQKSIAAWDNLKPSEELLREMAQGLMRQLQREDWQRGVGIPHASTWLNQRRWEDTGKKPIAPAAPSGWAKDEEVLTG